MAPADGLWGNTLTKSVTAFLPLSHLQGLPDGLVRVWVHAKDVAGNWGPFQAMDLVLDHTAPAVSAVTNTAPAVATTTTAPATLPLTAATLPVTATTGFPATGGTVAVTTSTGTQVLTYTGVTANTLTGVTGGSTAGATIAASAPVSLFTGSAKVTAHDVVTNGVASGIAKAEWWVGTDPGPGNATAAVTIPTPLPIAANTSNPQTFTITGLPAGKTVNVRVADAAGNWSAPMQVVM